MKSLLSFIFHLVKLANLLQNTRIRLHDSQQLMIPFKGGTNITHHFVNIANLENNFRMLLMT